VLLLVGPSHTLPVDSSFVTLSADQIAGLFLISDSLYCCLFPESDAAFWWEDFTAAGLRLYHRAPCNRDTGLFCKEVWKEPCSRIILKFEICYHLFKTDRTPSPQILKPLGAKSKRSESGVNEDGKLKRIWGRRIWILRRYETATEHAHGIGASGAAHNLAASRLSFRCACCALRLAWLATVTAPVCWRQEWLESDMMLKMLSDRDESLRAHVGRDF